MDIYEALDKLKQNKRIDRTARRKQLVEKKLAQSSDKKPVKKSVKKLNKSLKESVSKKPVKKLNEGFSNDDYYDIIEDLVDSVKYRMQNGSEFDEAVLYAVDERLIYNDDVLCLADQYDVIDYGELRDRILDDLYFDIQERLGEDEEDEEENS